MPPPPPLFGYKYWKCYYPKSATTFEAAALYSVDVDYFKFGACRLVDGKYFCGALAINARYKGLESTLEVGDHLGTDSPSGNRNSHVAKYDAQDYDKLQRPVNPQYYAAVNPGPHNNQYEITSDNNGQPLAFNTYKNGDTTALYSHGAVRQPVLMSYSTSTGAGSVAPGALTFNANDASNYAMTPGGQNQYGGVHISSGIATSEGYRNANQG